MDGEHLLSPCQEGQEPGEDQPFGRPSSLPDSFDPSRSPKQGNQFFYYFFLLEKNRLYAE